MICSFVPRKVDYHPLAVPIPYNHANVDSDEVLFYAGGDYEARRGSGIEQGSISLHPSGFTHGPQPGAVERALGAERVRGARGHGRHVPPAAARAGRARLRGPRLRLDLVRAPLAAWCARMVTLDLSVAGATHAADRLRREEMIWITTVRGDGQPQTSAVWFHWDGTDFLLFSQPRAQKVRNLAAEPRVSLNLNGTGYGADLVIIEGTAEILPDYASGPWPEPARAEAYYAKYEQRAAGDAASRLRPRWRQRSAPPSGSPRPAGG